ncbi:INO80 complex subunit E [Microcaecilia unicolor]|uniref:INO80 complex subunit E n=1 Tax=Microcaecilia unicolor TaxID=1415580 RepID=A0A6P7YHT4_9AMPH|nr:INO80 complex subunit E [Microcaecilia unicolor]XP_030064583.1 INO80 complex subunit E [Microcaecilia unicolor]
MNGQGEVGVDYRRKYKNLKRKLKFLIYEQECFQEELRKAQRKLLKVSRDKSFLLDRLLQYEAVDEGSSDSDATASSETVMERVPKFLDTPTLKRKRSPQLGGATSPSSSLSLQTSSGFPLQPSGAPSPYISSMTSPPYAQFPSEYLAPIPGSTKTDRSKRERKARTPKPKRSKIPLSATATSRAATLSFTSPRAGSLTPLPSTKLRPPIILNAVPQQMFSDTGEGSGEDGLDGDDDDLVIDIPE